MGAADKLVRSFAALLEALNRHRGKGQQVVRVEHVTVQAGGQAIVGAVTQGGGGGHRKVRIEPMHRHPWPMHRSPRCGARTRQRQPVPVAGGEGQGTLPDARRGRRQRRPGR